MLTERLKSSAEPSKEATEGVEDLAEWTEGLAEEGGG